MNCRKFPLFLFAFIAMCTIFVFTGCGSDPAVPSTVGVEPEIINGTQSFEFQVTAVENYTGSWSYTWDNAGTLAAVDQSSVLSDGSAVLVIKDASGEIVYDSSLVQDGSFSTSGGVAGNWVLTITLVGASGDLNFRVEEGF